MKRSVWADEQVEATVSAGFVPVMIDVDDPDAAAVSSRYRVGATPTTIITDPQGKVLQRVEGGMGKADFLELLEDLNPTAAPLSRLLPRRVQSSWGSIVRLPVGLQRTSNQRWSPQVLASALEAS